MNEAFGINNVMIGILLTVLHVYNIGGVHRVSKVSEVIVPVMALAYIFVALIVVIMNITQLPTLISLIVKSAFGAEQVVGGTMGAALLTGIKRGLFSNEAGMGSAPNAAATATATLLNKV